MSFPGLTEYLLSGQFTLQHGISPSICTINCAPVPKNKLVEQGTLDLRFGTVRITFPGCKIDKIDGYKNEDGLERWSVSILDRRWKWKFAGVVSGHWNVRKGEILVGQNLAKPTVRTAKQLAEICLDAMKEERYDTKDFPNDVFPEVTWDFTNAASALAQLADIYGFRVVLEINDKVALRKVGVGKLIPILNEETQLSKTIDPPERPDELIFAGSPNRHQFDLELEPVLRDFDGEWKHIDDVSYAPKNAAGIVQWGRGGTPFTAEQLADNPKLAAINRLIEFNLYRAWRIKEPFTISLWDNAGGGAMKARVLNRRNILPLQRTLIDTETIEKHVKEREPLIYGLWWGQNTGVESTYHILGGDGGRYETLPTGDVATAKDPLDPLIVAAGKCAKALYTLGWDINYETGYVALNDPATRTWPLSPREDRDRESITVHSGSTLRTWHIAPAKLWLRVAFEVRGDRDTGSRLSYRGVRRKMPGKPLGAGFEYVRAPDSRFKIVEYKDFPVKNNEDEFLSTAKHYLDSKQKEYDLTDFGSATVAGFKAYNPDGAIQQVSWEVTASGFAYTRISRNKEEIFAGVSYTERRLFERTKFLLDHPGAAIGMIPGGGK